MRRIVFVAAHLLGACDAPVTTLAEAGVGEVDARVDSADAGRSDSSEPTFADARVDSADAGRSDSSEPTFADARVEPRTFKGRVGTLWVDAVDAAFEPVDLTTWQITARAGADLVVSGSTDGTFTFEALTGEVQIDLVPPPGMPWLFRQPISVVTALDELDLSLIKCGRLTPAPSPQTGALLDGRFVEPWRSDDELWLSVASLDNISWPLSEWVAQGAARYGPFTLDFSLRTSLRGLPGDDLILARSRTSSSAVGGESVMIEYGSIRSVAIPDGAMVPMTLDLTPAELGPPRRITFDGDPKGRVTEIHPNAQLERTSFGVAMLPQRADPTLIESLTLSPSLWTMSRTASAQGTVDRSLPLAPLGWRTYRFLSRTTRVQLSSGNLIFAGMLRRDARDIAPGDLDFSFSIGFPRDLRVAGQDAHGEMSAVGLTPEIRWSAPATGSIDGYELRVERLDRGAGFAGRAWTTSTHFRIPTGWLLPGARYAITLHAIHRGGAPVVARPVHRGLVDESATVVTEPFSP